MAPQSDNDLQSTEKLLNLIRSKNSNAALTDTPSLAEKSAMPQRGTIFHRIALKKTTIGVDVGHNHIKLAKIRHSDKRPELIDYTTLPFGSGISLKDPTTLQALKSALDQFCADCRGFELWGAIQSANVETQFVLIPKLPRKQISNAIFWSFTKKTPYDKHSEMLDFEILGDISEGGVKKTQALVFKAPKTEVETFRNAFRAIGYPLTGISIAAFAIQNLFRSGMIPHDDEDACCLFIGRDWSRIAIYAQGNMVLSRGIKTGMRSMIEAVHLALHQQNQWSGEFVDPAEEPEDSKEHTPKAIDSKAQKLFFDFIGVQPAGKGEVKETVVIDQGKVFQMISPALERLIRQVERTLTHYSHHFTTEGVKRIFVSGQIIASQRVMEYLDQQLDPMVVPMNPFPEGGHFTRNVRIPGNSVERESYVPAIGLALSSNSMTPNLLHTHEDRFKAERVRTTNMRILGFCMVCLMVLIGIFSWQLNQLDDKQLQIQKYGHQLTAYNPPVGKKLLLAFFAKIQHQRQNTAAIGRRYKPAAVITEISNLTPSTIRLLSIDANFAQGIDNNKQRRPDILTVEGVIFGDPDNFETSLTSYLLSLKNSPMFHKPDIQRKQIEYYNNQEVLRFVTRLEII